MTQTVSSKLQRQCDALVTKGVALSADEYRYINPEMTSFIGSCLLALSYDVYEVASNGGQEQRVLLPPTLGELHDLIHGTQRRIKWAKGTSSMDGSDGAPQKGH